MTGSHAAKVGVTYMHSSSHVTQSVVNNATTYQMLGGTGANGVITGTPNRVTVFATPLTLDAVMKANMGIFAQDQWTVRRLTLNLGVRFDYFNAYVPAQHISQGPNVPTRSVDFAQVDNVPNWKNTSPRLGASYDLFGTGKTALKVSLGRYMEAPNLTTITRVMDPAAAIVNSATRTWGDTNRDFVPQPTRAGAGHQRELRHQRHHPGLRRRRPHDARLQLGRVGQHPARADEERLGQRRATSGDGSAT